MHGVAEHHCRRTGERSRHRRCRVGRLDAVGAEGVDCPRCDLPEDGPSGMEEGAPTHRTATEKRTTTSWSPPQDTGVPQQYPKRGGESSRYLVVRTHDLFIAPDGH